MSKKYVYLFTEGNGSMRELLGGKGANLAEMTNLGLPVPQGFTITTEACTQYYEDGRKINDEIQAEIMEYIDKMFGDLENPLLVSVRSGARASMPGMMDTILNLGLNEEVVEVIAKKILEFNLKSGINQLLFHIHQRIILVSSKLYRLGQNLTLNRSHPITHRIQDVLKHYKLVGSLQVYDCEPFVG